MKTKEVKLAEEGTIMAKFQKERTDAISEMFDNKYEDGIYPTSKFFIRLDDALLEALSQQRQEIVKDIEKAQKKWKPCNDKNCGNRDECERANHYIETIWNPTFEELKKTLTK